MHQQTRPYAALAAGTGAFLTGLMAKSSRVTASTHHGGATAWLRAIVVSMNAVEQARESRLITVGDEQKTSSLGAPSIIIAQEASGTWPITRP